jgi:ribosomal protein L7Ae-like RNA K-turn-binding protein
MARSKPERTCNGCSGRGKPSGMVRFVADFAGALQIDVRHRLPGRGAYLHLRQACIERALRQRSLQRALGVSQGTDSAEELLSRMRASVETRFLERLGLARRAGRVVSGTVAVRRAMKQGQAGHVCIATDSSEATQRQLASNCRRKEVSVSKCFEGARLGRAVGTDFIAALAITAEPFAGELTEMSTSLEELIQAPGGTHE